MGGGSLRVNAKLVVSDVHIGDSIAVNGICLTVTSFDKNGFTADVMPETIRRTSLSELGIGSPVNLERALTACVDENTRQGVDMILKSFIKVLEGEGVEEINPVGEVFDPSVAEAIMAMPAGEGEESGIVKQVYVKGYKKGEKVLRYAQVIVTQ